MKRPVPECIDEYIANFPPDVQAVLEQVRATIRAAAPQAEEAIKYCLPTFVLHGNLVHFGAFQNHLGFYATPSGNEKFRRELAKYDGAKGSVQFPWDEPIPYDLIAKIVRFRVQENTARATNTMKKTAKAAKATKKSVKKKAATKRRG
jgi:uncharacterized protein YdhG (YjbR/CyaY superfamily)